MELNILVGCTVPLDRKDAEYYMWTAWERLRRTSEAFRAAEKKAKKRNARVRWVAIEVGGSATSAPTDIETRTTAELKRLKRSLSVFRAGVNHFSLGGFGRRRDSAPEIVWAVVFHFE